MFGERVRHGTKWHETLSVTGFLARDMGRVMGLFRKAASIGTAGLIDLRSDKERIARYTKQQVAETRALRMAMTPGEYDPALPSGLNARQEASLAKMRAKQKAKNARTASGQ